MARTRFASVIYNLNLAGKALPLVSQWQDYLCVTDNFLVQAEARPSGNKIESTENLANIQQGAHRH